MKISKAVILVGCSMALVLFIGMATASCGKSETAQQAETHQKNAAELVGKGDQAGAVGEYTQAIALDPKSDLAYEGRGVAYTEMKDYARAVEDLTKAIEIAPDRGGPYYERGIAYHLQGNLQGAVADLSHAIGDRGKTRWRGALYERGLVYKEMGNLTEARADFERILQLEKERPGEADKTWAEKAQAELAALGK